MKDIIYFDQSAINSALSQLDGGYAVNKSISATDSEQSTEEHIDTGKMNVGASAIIKAAAAMESSDKAGASTTRSNTDLINKIIGDYSLDILLSDENIGWKGSIEEATEGDFVNIETEFSMVDFDLIQKVTNPESISDFIHSTDDEYQELKQLETKKTKHKNLTSQENARLKILKDNVKVDPIWNTLMQFGRFGSLLYGETIVTNFKGALSFTNRNNYRLTTPELYMLTSAGRKARFIAKVTQVQGVVHDDGAIDEIAPHQAGLIPKVMTEILLGSSKMLHEGDRILNVYAIYFE